MTKNEVAILLLTLFIIIIMVIGGLFGYPHYNVWQQNLAGQAELARAAQNRQIRIQEAMAVKESARMLAEAEVERARGVAEANEIVQQGLGGPEGYLRYLYIEGLKEHAGECPVIYVPTEAGLPILEAGKDR